MILTTGNIDTTLNIFGESIVLYKMPYEIHVTYETNESYFWAKVCLLKFFPQFIAFYFVLTYYVALLLYLTLL